MTRILLVEDDADVQIMIEHVLLDEGYQVDTTGTVSGARKLLRRCSYELIVADGRLPDGTGMDIADAATEHDTKTLVITGYAFTLPLGTCDRYEILLKPLRPIEIIRAVERSLQD